MPKRPSVPLQTMRINPSDVRCLGPREPEYYFAGSRTRRICPVCRRDLDRADLSIRQCSATPLLVGDAEKKAFLE